MTHSTHNLGKNGIDVSIVTPRADGEATSQISPRHRTTHHGPLARGIAATILTIGLASIPSTVEAKPAPLEGASSAPRSGLVTRADLLLARASSWLTANNGKPVPYSQTHYWDENRRRASSRARDGYRQDCSGFIAMAAKLGEQPNTEGLYEYTGPISTRELKPGDLLIDRIGDSRSRHVVIFEKWANKAHTEYWAFEQRGGHGTDHQKRNYGLVPGDEYEARRLKTIVD
jgi:cell wall-associated NlpC family hydrolase